MVGIDALINYVDFFAGIYTIINLSGVYFCVNQIVKLTKEYFADPQKWETQKWPKWVEEEKEYADAHIKQIDKTPQKE